MQRKTRAQKSDSQALGVKSCTSLGTEGTVTHRNAPSTTREGRRAKEEGEESSLSPAPVPAVHTPAPATPLPSGKPLGTKSQPEALIEAVTGESAPVARVLLDPWHLFLAQRKDVLPSNLLGPGAPSVSNYQCFLLRITLCPAAFPCTPALISRRRQQTASTRHLLLLLSIG